VKIRDNERLEPPHVTILKGTRSWRLSLRTGRLLDRQPSERLVPKDLIEFVRTHLPVLAEHWDSMYPSNPVRSSDGEDE
jgi:hypothetical protein